MAVQDWMWVEVRGKVQAHGRGAGLVQVQVPFLFLALVEGRSCGWAQDCVLVSSGRGEPISACSSRHALRTSRGRLAPSPERCAIPCADGAELKAALGF